MKDKVINLSLVRGQREVHAKESVKEALENALEELKETNWEQGILILIRRDDDEHYYTDMKFANCSTLESRGILLSAILEEAAVHTQGEE